MKFYHINTDNVNSLLKYIKEGKEYSITITQVRKNKNNAKRKRSSSNSKSK